jgi:hypothetical protein
MAYLLRLPTRTGNVEHVHDNTIPRPKQLDTPACGSFVKHFRNENGKEVTLPKTHKLVDTTTDCLYGETATSFSDVHD